MPSIGQTKPAIKQATNLLIEEGNLQSDFVSFEVLFHNYSSFAIDSPINVLECPDLFMKAWAFGLTITSLITRFRIGAAEYACFECTGQAFAQ